MDFFLLTLLTANTVCLSLITVGFSLSIWYIRRRRLWRILSAMDDLVDTIINSVESEEGKDTTPHNTLGSPKVLSDAPTPDVDVPHERLAALAAGGRARKFLGREYTAAQIDSLPPDEVERLYGRYQARLGSQIAESLGDSIIGLYCHVVSRYLPIDDKEDLASDLKGDAFLGAAISGVCCELYYRFGSYLAPVSAALTTAKHITIRPRSGETKHLGLDAFEDDEPTPNVGGPESGAYECGVGDGGGCGAGGDPGIDTPS
jgi:hypothetical protein